jgi:hypothetical protein
MTRRTISSFLAAALMLAVPVVGPATAGAAAPWSAPSVLGPTGREVGEPQIAFAPDGEAIVAWEGGKPNGIQLSTRPPGGEWSAPVALGKVTESEGPHLAVSAGKAVVVWRGRPRGHGSEGSVTMAATRLAGKGWGKPQNISKETRWRFEPEGRSPQAAINAAGKAVAIWEAGDEGHSTTSFIRSATQSAKGTAWTKPVGLPGSIEGESPEVGLTSAGETVATWSSTYDEESGLEVATRPAKGKWKRSGRLDRPGGYATPQLMVTPSGEAIAYWVSSPEDNIGATLETAARKPGGKWVVRPLAPKSYSTDPSLVAVPGGGVRMFWTMGAPFGDEGEPVSSTRPPGGTWSAPAPLAAAGLQIPHGSSTRFAVTGSGEEIAIFGVNDLQGGSTVQTASRPAGGTWGTPVVLCASPPSPLAGAADVQVAVAPNGEILEAWHRWNGHAWTIEVASRP